MCTSASFGDKKTGIELLHQMFKNAHEFTPRELEKITSAFTRMFVDPHNKIGATFIDALCDFVYQYRNQLSSWLYVLLTRLLIKSGSEMLASMGKKLSRCLDIVRSSFAPQLQFHTLVRYILDPAQTPSMKVKWVMLEYMTEVVRSMDANDLRISPELSKAFTRIVDWTREPKSAEVRKETVYQLLNSNLNNSSHRSNRSSLSPGAEASNFDLGSVHASLRETSAQINNYFGNGDHGPAAAAHGKGSHDSGIVDAAGGQNGDGAEALLGLMGGLSLGSSSSTLHPDAQEEIISDIMTELSNHNTRVEERVKAMHKLKAMTRDGTFTLWDDHFKAILMILLETLGDEEWEPRVGALKTLRELCQCQAPRFRECAELTLLKVLEVEREPEKEVGKFAEECGVALATHLPPAICFRVLNPIIANEKPPGLNASIKMLTKVVSQLNKEEAEAVLEDVVPGVVKAYDNSDSSVRKASVCCLVELHNLVGADALAPFTEHLSSSKMKLLNLYIKRTQGGGSV